MSCSWVVMACFQDPKIEFREIGDIYESVDKEEFIFDLAFTKRYDFVALVACLKSFEYFLC